MKASKWMSGNGYYQGEILQHSGGDNMQLISVDKILEQYAQHDAQERYDKAVKLLNKHEYDTIGFVKVRALLYIAAGKSVKIE